MYRYLSAFVLGAALLAPAALRADDDHHRVKVKVYYDREGRDRHEWNDNENQAHRRYLQEQHREYREFDRNTRQQQADYWRWRHNHPDR
jgi:basic membrane lipoprotein Med (substrate-binding protein (PBP1-ABC) superfamily)